MKSWAKIVVLLSLLLAGATGASAQGSLYQNIAWRYTPAGAFPAAGATITICTSTATGTPCTPTVSVFADAALTQSVSNPLPACTLSPQFGCADGLGNFSFYATPGTYTYTVTGSGLTPYGPNPAGLPCVVGISCVSVGGNNAFSGSNTFLNINDILWVGAGAGSYNTIAAAVTAAGAVNKTIIGVRSTFSGTCPAATLSTTNPNITIWDFSGTCNPTTPSAAYNGYTFNFFDGNVQAQNRCGYSPNVMPGTANSAILCNYFITAPINLTVGTGNTIDGISAECDLFGTLTGTLPNCQAAEHDWTIATTGGTVTWAVAGMFYGGNTAGSTTAITNGAGIRTLGCKTGSILGPLPTNCYGLFADDQRANGSSRSFSIFGVGKVGVGYSPSQGIGAIYFEDHLNALHLATIYVDGTDALQVAALTTAGTLLQDSGGNNRAKIDSTGLRIFTAVLPNTAAVAPLGSTLLPFSNLCLGTAATNNFCTSVGATAAGRTIVVNDTNGVGSVTLPLFGSAGTGGMQTKRVASCTTAGAAASTCTTTVTWPAAFADANYTATCTIDNPTAVPYVLNTSSKAGASIVVTIVNLTAVAASGTLNCGAIHD